VGGGFFYENGILIQLRDQPMIWFTRADDDILLLNVNMPSAIPEPRLRIEENFWLQLGVPAQVVCPPSGRILEVRYRNGDAIRIEFFEVESGEALSKRYTHSDGVRNLLETEEENGLPVTAVEIRLTIIGPDGKPALDFDAQKMRIGGTTMHGAPFVRSGVGIRLG
jgi:hypothetical protein